MSKTEKIVLKGLRASYPHLFTPDDMSHKYTCEFILKKDNPQINDLKRLVKNVYDDAVANKCKLDPVQQVWSKLVRDGDIEKPEDENLAGCYFIKTSTTIASIKQNVFKRSNMGLVKITDESEFYGGCNCQASLVVSWYEFNGKYGLHFLLNGVCQEEGGEPFGRGANAASDFESGESSAPEDNIF